MKNKFEQYDCVKIIEIRKQFNEDFLKFNKRYPKEYDIGAIIEIYTNPTIGYEIECCDENGITEWMETFSPDEVVLELIEK